MTVRGEPEILVPISLAQAERVVQQVTESADPGASLVRVLLALGGQARVIMDELLKDPEFHDRKISRTLIVSLLVLSVFYGGAEKRVVDVAIEVGMSQSTTVRYLKSWTVVGALEQEPATRKYRLARRWRHILENNKPLHKQSPSA